MLATSRVRRSFSHSLGLLPLVFLFLVSSRASAEQSTGSIRGVVTDQTGGRLPGASVELRTETGLRVSATLTDGAGQYEFRGVDAGRYELTVSMPNFSTVRRTGIAARASEVTTADVVLSLMLSADVAVTSQRTFR